MNRQMKRACIKETILFLLVAVVFPLQPRAQTGEGRWYRGDLHTHSMYSNGDSPVADVIANAESLGFDFFALADHDNSMNGTPSHWFDPDYYSENMVLLYGVEWTSSRGHANIWAAYPFPYDDLWKANRENDLQRAVRVAHGHNALFSINHPGAFFCCPWEYGVTDGIDSIEVWNCMYRLPNFNQWTIRHFWDDVLKSGHRIPGVGGSDTHHLVNWQSALFGHGNPTTWVYAGASTAESILAGIRTGRVSISYASSAVRLDFTADADGDGIYETMVGDSIDHQPGQEISFKVAIFPVPASETGGAQAQRSADVNMDALRLNHTYGLGIFKNGELFRNRLVSDRAPVTFADSPGFGEKTYYRTELYGIPQSNPLYLQLYGVMIALTNPIYINY
jgi:hypothetical protein